MHNQVSHQHSFHETCCCRLPERLVLDGYRYWAGGFLEGDVVSWTCAWELYATKLGASQGRAAMDALSGFVKTLGICSRCPLRMYKPGSNKVCCDETLILGLIAAIQHSDQKTAEFCLRQLTCATKCEEVSVAAAHFAFTLKVYDHLLTPVPMSVIENAICRNIPEPASSTLH